MLRREVVCHPGIIDNGQPNESLFARPWQRKVSWEEQSKARDSHQKREHDEPDRLGPQEWSIRLSAVGQIRAAHPVTDPEHRS